MKKIKKGIFTVYSIFLLVGLSACSSNEDTSDTFASGFNDWLQSFSKYAMTKDRKLEGDRLTDIDSYTGSYEANYDDFDGEEIIFGGTALNRDHGKDLSVSYLLEVTSGTAKLYWAERSEEHTIAEENAEGTYKITLDLGDNYIGLKGSNFTGNLKLKVE